MHHVILGAMTCADELERRLATDNALGDRPAPLRPMRPPCWAAWWYSLALAATSRSAALASSSSAAWRRARRYDEQELYRTTLGSIGDAVMTTDREGRVTFLNAIAERLTGWTAQRASRRRCPANGFPHHQ